MSLLSSSVSVTRYRVDGKLADSVIDSVRSGLKNSTIREIENEPDAKSVGWTSFEAPFTPDFEIENFVIAESMVFCLRIDKKSIPAKIINKQFKMAVKKRLSETGREHLSKNEKTEIKDDVLHRLYVRVPATPNVYDIVWNYEAGQLFFFSNLKEANEELETLFSKSFKLTLIRMFPYTVAELSCGLLGPELDAVSKLSPSQFYEARNA
ncbi:MAG: recombination-associated protein RdgC [Deltaproteobacteria bacterium]|nr:recombination-associated protein RdgC [Deltaproteobacteria bacterium]